MNIYRTFALLEAEIIIRQKAHSTHYTSATDDLEGFTSIQLNVTIHSVQDDVGLWSLVNSFLKQPMPKFQERERRILASDCLLNSKL